MANSISWILSKLRFPLSIDLGGTGGNLDAIAMPNIALNGAGQVNQRGYVSGTATTVANQFTLDRWKVAVSGQSLTYTDDTYGRTMTAPAGGLVQVVEGAPLTAGLYTFSWVGSATLKVNGVAVTNGGTVTLPAATDVTCAFVGTFKYFKMEKGSFPTPFQNPAPGEEEFRCLRYAWKWKAAGEAGVTNGAGGDFGVKFPTPMRAIPTYTPISIGAFVDGLNSGTPSAVNIGSVKSTTHTHMTFNTAGATTAGRGCVHFDHTGLFSCDI